MDFAGTYKYYMEDLSAENTRDWLFVRSPVPPVLVTVAYLFLILRWGPRFMKNKEPYSCATFIKFYNFSQVLINFAVVYGTIQAGWLTDHPNHNKIADYMRWAMLVRVIDYTETLIFVLRKKHRQITFLHLYHHTSTPLYAWLMVKYSPSGKFVFLAIVNSGVHVIMYAYYFLTIYGPAFQRILQPVKPFVTIIQMVQFCAAFVHLVQTFAPSSKEPRFLTAVFLTNTIINFVLFYNFYQKSYKKPKVK